MLFKVTIFTLILGIHYCRGEAEDGPPAGDPNSQAAQPQRFEKNYFPKDVLEGSNARAIMGMREELTSLEENVKYLNDGVKSITLKTYEIEATALRQEATLMHLEKSFEGVEKTLFSHTDLMDELVEIIGPNDKTYSVSNNSCGDILSGQSGYISFTDTLTLQSGNFAYDCVWTIQAGHHSFIKFNIQTLTLPSTVKVYLVELANTRESPSQLSTIVRELHQGLLYQVKGPLAFIVLSTANISYNYILSTKPTIHIRYEGTGRLSHKKTQFNHKFLNFYGNLTSFTQNGLENWKDQSDGDEGDGIAPIQDFTYETEQNVVVLNKLTTPAFVKFYLDRTTCQNSSFLVISDLLANGTRLTNYCERNSSDWTDEKLIFGTPMVFLIKNPIQNKLSFNISWRAEQLNSGSWNGTSNTSCTERLGGTSGFLSFRGYQTSSLRCVWVIKPQTSDGNYSSITLTSINRIGNSYATFNSRVLWLAVELTDKHGDLLPTPKVTDLLAIATSTPWRSCTLFGKEVYIVYSSEPSVSLRIFSLRWYVTRYSSGSPSEITASPRYTFLEGDQGTLTRGSEVDFLSPILYDVFILSKVPPRNTSMISSIVPEMHLDLFQTLPDSGQCFTNEISVFTQVSSTVQKRSLHCKSPRNATLAHTDGLALIVIKKNSTQNQNQTVNYNWRQGKLLTTRKIVHNVNKCGGVIVGTAGTISYKLNQRYEGNERCIWLLHAPNCSSITLSLTRSGFYGSRYLVANTINPNTGEIEDAERSTFTSSTPTHHISRDFLVLLFQTINGSTIGTGFSMEFQGMDCREPEEDDSIESIPFRRDSTHFELRHFSSAPKTVSYKVINETNKHSLTGNELHVIAYSEPVTSFSDTYKMSTALDWINGHFQNEQQNGRCVSDSVKIYTISPEDASTFYNSQTVPVWLEKLSYPRTPFVCQGVVEEEEKTDAFDTDHFAFLIVYKVISIRNESVIDERRGIEFSYRKVDSLGRTVTTTTTTPRSTTTQRHYTLDMSESKESEDEDEEDFGW